MRHRETRAARLIGWRPPPAAPIRPRHLPHQV